MRTSVSGLSSEVWNRSINDQRTPRRQQKKHRENVAKESSEVILKWLKNFLSQKYSNEIRPHQSRWNSRETSTWKVIKQSISNSARFTSACPENVSTHMRYSWDEINCKRQTERWAYFIWSQLSFFSLFSRSWKAKLLRKTLHTRHIRRVSHRWWFFWWNNWKKEKQKKPD